MFLKHIELTDFRNYETLSVDFTAKKVILLGNNAQCSAQTTSASIKHIQAGKLRALASFGAKRSPALPDVPTLKELGYDVEYYLWVGIFAPKGTPASVTSVLSAALDKAADTPTFRTLVKNIGQEYAYLNAKDFAAFWDTDAKRAEDAVRLIGKQ